MQFSWKNPLKALPVLLLLAAYAGAAFGVAGNVQFVIGDVKLITKAGVTRALQKGAEVNEGDRIVAAANASAQIRMVDGGFIAIRPNTDLSFDTYRYNGVEDGTENAVVSLLQGGFRTITGIIGRKNKDNYLIKTDTATIGIRGTDHEPMVILRPALGQVAIAPPGTYDKVNVGVAYIRTDAGSVDIQRNQVGFAPVTRAAPVILPKIPPFYKPTPAPGPQKAKEEGKKDTAQGEAAPIRSTAVTDPASTSSATPASASTTTAPVVAITATDASGLTLNATDLTTTTASGFTTSIGSTAIEPPPTPTVSNPVVASGNYDFGVIAAAPVTGGVDLVTFGSPGSLSGLTNTNFVLSNDSLVEIRQSPYARVGLTSSTPTIIANANIKFSGGTAADVIADPNGTYYMGRWSGGQINVTDLATVSPVAPFADALGTSSVHWLVGLTPGNAAGTSTNNVQALVGTASYSLVAATHPTDAFGNVGKLNSATLTADFSAQTVDSNLNLSFSSTDPVNVSKRNLNLTAAATKMPIENAGFGGAVIASTIGGVPTGGAGINNTVSCSGADCAADGYVGSVGGVFLAAASGGSTSGAVGTNVGLNYGFIALPTSASTATQPFSDYITGAAVLSTSAVPAAGTAAVPIAGGTGKYWQQVYSPQAVGGSTYASVYTLASGVPSNAQNYAFDTSGNLLRLQNAGYLLSDRGITAPPSYSIGAVPYTGTPGGLPSSPLANVAVSFSGGTAPDGNYNDTVNGIRMGRYAGGTITTTDVSTSAIPLTYSTPLGNNSFIWAVREIPVSIPLAGSFEYIPVYATKPTDSLGNVGTLNYASLAANFTAQTVSPAVNITINNQNLYAAASNVPIDSQYGFSVSSSSDQNPRGGGVLRATCYGSNCAPAPVGINTSATPYLGYIYTGYGGRIQGGLAGASAADGAFFRYTFDTYYNPAVAAGSAGGVPSGQTRPVNDYVDGLVAFTKGASIASITPVTAGSGDQFFRTAYLAHPSVAGDPFQSWTDAYRVSSTGYTNPFGAGDPNTIGNPSGSGKWETLSGGTVAEAATNANSYAATGISFGRYDGGTLTGVDAQGLSFTRTMANTYAWIKGPVVPFQTAAMTGAARYNFDGGTQNGSSFSGTVNSAFLAVNFNTAAVGVDLSVTGNGGAAWTATTTSSGALTGNPATTLRLGDKGSFYGSSWNVAYPAMHESLYVTKNGSALSTPGISGQINGQLTGSNLSGAALTYSFEDTSSAQGGGPQGAVAFALESFTSTPTPNNAAGSATLTPTTITGTSAIDVNNVPYQMRLGTGGIIANAAATPPNAPASVDPNRFLTHVVSEAQNTGRLALGPDGLTTSWDSYRNITTTPTCSPTPCAPFVTQVPARASIDPASFVATGATPGSGQIALPAGKSPATVLESGFDPATGMRWGRYGAGVIAYFDRIGGTAPGLLDVSTQNAHTIIGPTQTGQTALPVTGVYTYSNVGGTHPTDNLGNVGTLNAATLVADFGAQTVNTGVNLTMSGQTWAAGGSAVPISQAQFAANRDISGGGNLNICVGSSCGATTLPSTSSANTSGKIIGTFTGTSGQGAGMAYSLNQGGIAGITVSGVAAFKH